MATISMKDLTGMLNMKYKNITTELVNFSKASGRMSDDLLKEFLAIYNEKYMESFNEESRMYQTWIILKARYINELQKAIYPLTVKILKVFPIKTIYKDENKETKILTFLGLVSNGTLGKFNVFNEMIEICKDIHPEGVYHITAKKTQERGNIIEYNVLKTPEPSTEQIIGDIASAIQNAYKPAKIMELTPSPEEVFIKGIVVGLSQRTRASDGKPFYVVSLVDDSVPLQEIQNNRFRFDIIMNCGDVFFDIGSELILVGVVYTDEKTQRIKFKQSLVIPSIIIPLPTTTVETTNASTNNKPATEFANKLVGGI